MLFSPPLGAKTYSTLRLLFRLDGFACLFNDSGTKEFSDALRGDRELCKVAIGELGPLPACMENAI